MIPKSNPEYQKFRRIVLAQKDRLDFERQTREALAMHDSRKTVTLAVSKHRYNPRYVYDAIQMDMTNRGRYVRMIQSVKSATILLDEAMRAFRGYVHIEFREELGKTREDRTHALDAICRPALAFLSQCDAHIEMLETLIKDIDQANFQFRHLVALLDMINEKGVRNV